MEEPMIDFKATPLADRRIPAGDDFLNSAQLSQLTSAELARRTRALFPMVAGHAAEAERLRRPVDAVWSALRASGYFYQFVPRAFGGLAADFDGFMDATLPIAEACASTGWTAAISAATNRTLAHFPVETQEEIWGGAYPYVIAPQLSPFGEPAQLRLVDGGLRASARWGWATGIMHADWIIGVVMEPRDRQPPGMAALLFPAAEAQVLDNWHADGMAGTGSNEVGVTDLFVPHRRILRDIGIMSGQGFASRRYPEPIYRTPLFLFQSGVAAVPVLGAARRAMFLFRERLMGRVQKGADARQAEKPVAQIRLAEADLMLAAAELLLRDAGRRSAALGEIDGPTQVAGRIAMRAQFAHAVRLCRNSTLHLAEAAGSSAHLLDQPLQRVVRDICVMASHAGFDIDLAMEQRGRALLGLPPTSALI